MLRLLLGFIGGVYVGTYYNCKPVIKKLTIYIKKNLPEEKEEHEKKNNVWSLFDKISVKK